VLPTKPVMAICSGIFLEGKDNNLTLISTDLENTVKVNLECEVKEKGQCVVNGKQFISLIKQLKGKDLEIEKKEKTIEIKEEFSKYTFIEMEVEDFPKIPKVSSDITFKIKGETLKESFKKVIFCIDPENPKHEYRGGLLDIREKFINIVGTDTRRLSLFSILFETPFKKTTRVLLSYSLMKKMINILNEEEVEVSIGKNNISFQTNFTKNIGDNKKVTGSVLFISQLLAGVEEFHPNYEKVIPDIKKSKISYINTDLLLSSLKRISIFTSEINNKVKLSFKKDFLTISTSGEQGEAVEKIGISYNDEETEMAFSPDFLIDFLQVNEKETFLFAFTSPTKPVLMKPEENSNFSYVCVTLKTE
ncbi:MAG: DNA polymerase III subunit beta, partial [bacterium]|nr:DNA polymerase III subunit beta [bacterium]MDW8163509.1 DNA polymerase III subunit beta [Candidatus Omnitrophota bacterium]